jgi:preprotein translocase subunit SecB
MMTAQAGNRQQFEIQRVYLKDVSFEAPNSPQIFSGQWKPEINVQLLSERIRLEASVHEVVLAVTITAKLADKTAYLVEVKQAGVFAINGFGESQLNQLLGSYCPNVLFPFAREAIADLIGKGGFPNLLLAPINFDALYAQQQQHREKANDSGAKH